MAEVWSPLLLTGLILLPLLSALVLLPARSRRVVTYVACGVPSVQCAVLLTLWPRIRTGEEVRCSWSWLPDLGFHLSFALDGLSWLFAGLIAGVGVLVFVYAAAYLRDDPLLNRLYRLLLFFNGAMMGVVLADNLILLIVFWELTSVASFLLIGFRSHRTAACEGATKALLLTASGGLVMLFGVFLIAHQQHTLELSALLSGNAQLSTLIGVCFLVGAFTKSAQFPFHIWLPAAMEAPTPVSAYLHAATMVKAGIYLVARLSPLFAEDPLWTLAVSSAGAVTVVWGGVLASKQTDLKALLAYSTVSQLGLIMMLLGLRTETAFLAALLHVVNHAMFKGSLFLTAGAVEHATGTRDLRELGGLRAAMPLTALLAAVATLSMAGLPPLGGFISKELFYESALGSTPFLLTAAGTSGCLTFLYSFLFLHGTFWGAPSVRLHHAHEAPVGMLAPIGVLSGAALLLGIVPAIAQTLIEPALTAIARPAVPQRHIHLALWHGWTPTLGLSMLTTAVGIGVFLLRRSYVETLRGWRAFYSWNQAYDDAVTALNRAAFRLRVSHMTGRLTNYVQYLLVALVLGASAPLWRFFSLTPINPDATRAEYFEVALALLMAVGAIACCVLRSRAPLVLALGLVGALVSIFFVLFSAPDLALTQIVTDSVGLVLFLLVLRFLSPPEKPETPFGRQLLNVGISLASGVTIALLLLAANIGQLHSSMLAPFYLSNSHTLAGGKNVVNVIVVDFRGYDTLGETTVFGVVALGVFAMMRLGRKPLLQPKNPASSLPPSLILQSIARLTFHLMVLFSIYLLVRGHNAPGGGFIAGMLTAVAIVLYMMAFDIESFKQQIPWSPLRVVMLGLTIATFTGLGSLAFGRPFLTSAFGHFQLPLLGEMELATAALFDLGVYFVVVGTTLGVIRTIAEE